LTSYFARLSEGGVVRPFNIGIVLPTRGVLLTGDAQPDVGLVLSLAEQAESAGLDSVWVGDSLTAKPRLEPLATLAAVAARTQRVRLGTSVLLGALRHPVLLTQTAHTIDQVSHGRLTLAMGVGGTFTEGMRREWAAAGVPPEQRASRLENVVGMMRSFRQEGVVHFHGKHYTYDGPTMQPRPAQSPGVPLWLACHARTGAERQYRRASVLAEGIIGITDSPEEFKGVVDRVRTCTSEVGRDPLAMHAAFYMTVHIDENESQAAAEADTFLMRYYGVRHWGEAWGPFGGAARVADRMLAYHAAGAQTVILRFAAFNQRTQLARLVEHVLPRLG
jgi:alkanesulfonate monooxygenase SsuD/methylene tetrahydromethanopterin reductase-like flavin-dependent oxidoreductase (luciferase family)